MSRIIIKNLPKGIKEKKLKNLFSTRGVITDLQLKYNKKGVFRQFAFIGYKTEEEANAAKEYFHNSFLNTSKISVEVCANLGEASTLKKHKKEESFVKNKDSLKKDSEETEHPKEKKRKKFEIPEELKDDPKFKEFLVINEDRKEKPVWAEDIDTNLTSEEEEDSDKETIEESKEKDTSDNKISSKNVQESPKVKVKSFNDEFTVKLRNLPYQCKKGQIKKFFQSLKIISLRLPPRRKGFAYVSFKTEKDLKRALIKHRGILEGHRVDVVKYIKKTDETNQPQTNKFNENSKELNEELLAETGRIYVRNLCFSVTEEEIKEKFSKYGPVEVHVPIDFTTKQGKGFAFVTFMFAEHAVKAYSELDGKIFQGRLLHLIPAHSKKEYESNENESNYKKKKEVKRKKESGNSDNWNILFLGMNAVADVISEKHGIQKSELLSANSKESLPVRMALAETKMVEETRKFLVENGVKLDAFSQPAAEFSKTVIVVRHLPAKTTAEEINELFSKHGTISRVLVPPSGMVALVEFENPSEAKVAFSKLAYKQFHTIPLFLMWAPMGGLTQPPPASAAAEEELEIKSENESELDKLSGESMENITPEEGTNIYVKNLNFDTTEENFKKHFKQCGQIYNATISTKLNTKTGKRLSMGFGFVQFVKRESAIFALQNLQQSVLDGHSLELKFAKRSTASTPAPLLRKKYEVKKQTSSKICVRNIAFQASAQEIKELFKAFGSIKSIRLPKKLGKPNEHRGFGFVEYTHKEDAERAFNALCHSTHLFNRRLVLEWANADSETVAEIRKKTAESYLESGPKKKLKKSQLKEDVIVASARHGAGKEGED